MEYFWCELQSCCGEVRLYYAFQSCGDGGIKEMGLIIVDDTERVLFGKATKKVIRQILAMVVCVMVIGNADYRMSASDVRYKKNQQSVMDQVDIAQRAESLAHELIIADAHIYTPYRLLLNNEDIAEHSETGDFDYPRARTGGLNFAFMCIFVPVSHQKTGDSLEVADAHIDRLRQLVANHPDKFGIVTSAEEVLERSGGPQVLLSMGMINGAPIGNDLDRLRYFYKRGVRYIALAHSRPNQLSDSSFAGESRWGGLSPFGKDVVVEMNRLGMIIDTSHLSDNAFYQIIELSKAPIIASSSSSRHFTSGWERNIDDAMVKRLAENGGVVGINFSSDFLHDRYKNANAEVWHHLEKDGIGINTARGIQLAKKYRLEHNIGYATVSDVVDHIDHLVDLVGIDHVGLGSDFDGVGDSLPEGLKDVSDYPRLIEELLRRSYSEAEIKQLCSGNLLRVWKDVERIGKELRNKLR